MRRDLVFFRALCGRRANVLQPVQLIPPYVPRVAVLITRQMEGPAKEWGRGGGVGGGVEEGGGCDVFINKKQLCMMLTAGWSAPRPNPALLLLTFQRSGAYPRQCAQSSLSRSGSAQGSGGGRPWLSLSYQVPRNTLKQRGLCRPPQVQTDRP